MNVANLLNSRVKEVAAFSALLFQGKRSRSSISNNSDEAVDDKRGGGGGRPCRERRRTAHYRRPSSANVPLSDVLRLAKSRTQRVSRFALSEPGGKRRKQSLVKRKGQKKRVLTYEQWRLFLRRRRRLALRRRQTTCRRIRRRAIALRQGKVQQALCHCGADSALALESPLSSLALGCRTSVLWLPSHWRLCRRFHYRALKLHIDRCLSEDDDSSHRVTVRIAVPRASQRKQHRVLQRWVARMPGINSAGNSSRRRTGKPTALLPPMCFAAERSHLCVWVVQPLRTAPRMSVETVMDLLMLRTNGTPPMVPLYARSIESSLEGSTSSSSEGFWQRSEKSVFYGYMWSSAAKEDQSQSLESQNGLDGSTVAALVLPVQLVCVSLGNERVRYYLMAPAPVHIGPRARRNLSIRLASHWNPCDVPAAICSVFELWCSADALSMQDADDTSTGDGSLAAEWVRRRVDAAVVRWRVAAAGGCGGSSGGSVDDRRFSYAHGEEGQLPLAAERAVARKKMMMCCCFPSISLTTETIDHSAVSIHRCVIQILLLSAGSLPSSEGFGAEVCSVRQRRRHHFQFSRHLFASLTATSAAVWRPPRGRDGRFALALSRGEALGYTRSVRVIGEDERETLLRLAGCPAVADESGSSAAFQAPVARLRCSPSNAHQRVLLKFARRGGREHQSEGSALLVLRSGNASSFSASDPPAELKHIGAVTSGPFFSMRFGCRLAYAWVWDHSGWESVQHLHSASMSKQNCDPPNVLLAAVGTGAKMDQRSGNGIAALCFFTCAPGRLSHLLPHLSHSPMRVPGCGSTASLSQVKQGKVSATVCSEARAKCWSKTEAMLCDADVCMPVEVVRFGAAVSVQSSPLPGVSLPW